MASHAMELRRTQQRQDQEIKALARLKSSMYESHKARNPGRVENTCKWFLQHASYHSWRDTKSDALLWVSADPGCGKSVLTSSLIDIELAPNEQLTTCYFFFKDDIDEQQSVATALCAILHQLFQQRPALLSREANHILLEPEQFLRDIKGLWQFLRRVMQHSLAGHVMCILDGLDEGPESEISTLIELLSNFQQELPASPSSADMSTKSLKFLVTSRPYFSIKSQFQEAVDRFPAIHLSGEDESATIEEEIGLVIQSRTEVLTRRLRLSHNVSHALLRKLLEIPNRTYLWLHLMFNVLQSSTDRTERKLTIALETIPETVDQAYEKILERSTSREDATKILHVMLAARRPLTIHEINTILALKKGSTSYTDLDLEAAEHISETIRNICGLFVTIRGSEVYLFHMTARNFLLRQIDNTSHLPAPSKSFRWRQSFEIDHSNLIIAEACVDLLLLDEFYQQWVPGILHKSMIEFRPSKPQKSPDLLHPIFELLDSFAFGSYSARYWAFHFLAASQVERKVIHDRVLRLCESQRLCCSLWFPLYQRSSIPDLRLQYSDPTLSDGQWQSLKNLLPPATRLAFITSLGSLELVQDYIIAARTKGKEIFRFDSLLGSAFMVSVMCGHADIVKFFLGAYGGHDFRPHLTALRRSISKNDFQVFKILINNRSYMASTGYRSHMAHALFFATILQRNSMAEQLLHHGADILSLGKQTIADMSTWACQSGNDTVLHAILQPRLRAVLYPDEVEIILQGLDKAMEGEHTSSATILVTALEQIQAESTLTAQHALGLWPDQRDTISRWFNLELQRFVTLLRNERGSVKSRSPQWMYKTLPALRAIHSRIEILLDLG